MSISFDYRVNEPNRFYDMNTVLSNMTKIEGRDIISYVCPLDQHFLSYNKEQSYFEVTDCYDDDVASGNSFDEVCADLGRQVLSGRAADTYSAHFRDRLMDCIEDKQKISKEDAKALEDYKIIAAYEDLMAKRLYGEDYAAT